MVNVQCVNDMALVASMINETVERRIASYYMALTMSEDEYNKLTDTLIDELWQSNERLNDDELVTIGIKLINQIFSAREERKLN